MIEPIAPRHEQSQTQLTRSAVELVNMQVLLGAKAFKDRLIGATVFEA